MHNSTDVLSSKPSGSPIDQITEEKAYQIIEKFFRLFFILLITDSVEGVFRLITPLQNSFFGWLDYHYVLITRPILLLLMLITQMQLGFPRLGQRALHIFLAPVWLGMAVGICLNNEPYSILADLTNVLVGLFSLSLGITFTDLIGTHSLFLILEKQVKFWLLPYSLSFISFRILRIFNLILYDGFVCGPALLACFIYFKNKKYGHIFWLFFIILFSGRRADLVAFLGTLLLTFVLQQSPRRRLAIPLVLSWILTAIIALFAFFPSNFLQEIKLPVVEKILAFDPNRFDLTKISQFHRYMATATSGRWNEIMGVANEMDNNPSYLLTGKGLGATYSLYETDNISNQMYEKGKYRNVHFSPFNLLLNFGVTALIFIFLISKSIAGYLKNISIYKSNYNDKALNHTNLFFFQTCIAYLLQSLAAFVFFQEFFIWNFIGVGLCLLIKQNGQQNEAEHE